MSRYYHPKPGVSPASTGCPFDAFARLWLSERVEFGGWARHTTSWREEYRRNRGDRGGQVLWISFEELVSAPEASIRTIAAFLDLSADAGLVARVAKGARFSSVKEQADRALATGVQGNVSHLRKGEVGDWKTHFDAPLRAEFEMELARLVGDQLDDVAYDIGEGALWRVGDSAPAAQES